MSLKAFHVVFITAASALAFGCGVWEIKSFAASSGSSSDLLVALGAFGAGVALIFYERYFLKKLKDVDYL